MERIASFEKFKNNGGSMDEYNSDMESVTNENGTDDQKHYMFFRNLVSIKHNIEDMLKMNPNDVDSMLSDGHDWASDHIATANDDIQEVSGWLRGEFEYSGYPNGEEEMDGDDDMEDDTEDDMEDDTEDDMEDDTEDGSKMM